jgi:hypothetical protein
LKTFKTSKLKLLHTLGWQKKYLQRWVLIEYSYLVILWIIISVLIWTSVLYLLSYFIDFFTLDMSSYIKWIWLLLWLFMIMLVYLLLSKNKI